MGYVPPKPPKPLGVWVNAPESKFRSVLLPTKHVDAFISLLVRDVEPYTGPGASVSAEPGADQSQVVGGRLSLVEPCELMSG